MITIHSHQVYETPNIDSIRFNEISLISSHSFIPNPSIANAILNEKGTRQLYMYACNIQTNASRNLNLYRV
jgi:hypothetical protein